MEALVIIVLEFLAVLFWPVLAIFGAVLSALAEIVFELVRAVFRRGTTRQPHARDAERKTAEANEIVESSARAIAAMWRRLIGFLGVPVAIVLVPVITVNLFFFEPVARWATDRITVRTGIEIAYDEIGGDIFSGRLSITGLTVAKPVSAGPGIDLAVKNAQVDVNLWTMLSSEKRLDLLVVEGVTGRVEAGAATQATETPSERSPRKTAFAVSNVLFADIAVDIVPAGRAPVRLEISDATSPLFRSRYAAFDLFFRSNLDARVDGVPLVVRTAAVSDQSRRTAWRLDKAPAELIANLVGRAPATWFQNGTLTVMVDDFWDLDDLTIDMDWRLFLEDAEVAAPKGAGLRERALAGALNKAVKRRPDGVELAFRMYLDEETFEASGSRDLTALWNAVLPAIRAMLQSQGIVIGQNEPDTSDNPESENADMSPSLVERAKSAAGRVGDLFDREPYE